VPVATKGKKMNKLVTAVLALLATAVAANAANLPEKKATPAAPVAAAYPDSWYFGVNGGANYQRNDSLRNQPGVTGFVVGKNINKQFAVEGSYDYYFKNNGRKDNQRGTVNVLYTPIELFGFRPYALAGVGAEARDTAIVKNGDARAIYNVGGGVKYTITTNIDADVRYKYVKDWSGKDRDSNVVTFGINYKF
jgi:opacity protein-like surface antigen